jgi:hypothetical protein
MTDSAHAADLPGILLAAGAAAAVWVNVDIASFERVWHATFAIPLIARRSGPPPVPNFGRPRWSS